MHNYTLASSYSSIFLKCLQVQAPLTDLAVGIWGPPGTADTAPALDGPGSIHFANSRVCGIGL